MTVEALRELLSKARDGAIVVDENLNHIEAEFSYLGGGNAVLVVRHRFPLDTQAVQDEESKKRGGRPPVSRDSKPRKSAERRLMPRSWSRNAESAAPGFSTKMTVMAALRGEVEEV